jgi:peptide/nickel transport system permease protein
MDSSTRGSTQVVTVSPSDRDAETRSDGGRSGAATDLFTQESEETIAEGRVERLRRLFTSYIVAPVAIGWDDWRTRIGGLILLFYIGLVTIGPMLTPEPMPFRHDIFLHPFHEGWYTIQPANVFGIEIPWIKINAMLGSNTQGQSMDALMVYGGVPLMKMILTGAVFSVFLGTFLGVFAGYKGGRIDGILMTFTDIVLTVPGLALVVVLAALYQPESPYIVGIILGIDNWPGLTRTVRSQVLSIREESYIEAHRALGLPTRNILRRDIISQLMPYISINFANGARGIVFESVGLYFIGVLPYTNQNWGVLLQSAYSNISLTNVNQLFYIFEPMIMIAGLTIGLILFSQGLDKVFNVRLQARHEGKEQEAERAEEV